jgi:hypothetical protein
MGKKVLGNPAVDVGAEALATVLKKAAEHDNLNNLSAPVLRELMLRANTLATKAQYYHGIRIEQSGTFK